MAKNTYKKENLGNANCIMMMNQNSWFTLNRNNQETSNLEKELNNTTIEPSIEKEIQEKAKEMNGNYLLMLCNDFCSDKAVLIGAYKNNKIATKTETIDKLKKEYFNPRTPLKLNGIKTSRDSYGKTRRYLKYKGEK